MEDSPDLMNDSLWRKLVIIPLLVMLIFFSHYPIAWLNRSRGYAPLIEVARLDAESRTVYIDFTSRQYRADLVNTNGIFICSAARPSPEALHCKGEGDRVEPSHVHKDPFVWRVIWSEARPGHFSDISPDAQVRIPMVGMLTTNPLPDEVLEAIRTEDTYVVVAVDEKVFSWKYITKPSS